MSIPIPGIQHTKAVLALTAIEAAVKKWKQIRMVKHAHKK